MRPDTMDAAEARLRHALDSGDPQKIAVAAAEVDHLDTPAPTPTLLSSALWYAEQGIPVFALRPGIKQPYGRCRDCREPKCPGPNACGHDQCHGLLDATTDASRIAQWWNEQPQSNIGLATGHRFDVVDIDGPAGQKSRAEHWDDIFGQIDADCIGKVLTPRPGGMHIYVPATGDGNSANIVPQVDYRGIGGYVLAPPSIISPGGTDAPGTYRWLGTPTLGRAAKVA